MLRSPEAAAGLLAALLGTLHLVLLPTSGTDLAAQVARASFARAYPLTPVDLSWHSGTHPFAYSLLSPALMAVVGVGLSGLLAAWPRQPCWPTCSAVRPTSGPERLPARSSR